MVVAVVVCVFGKDRWKVVVFRVHLTVGNRSGLTGTDNRSGSGLGRYQTGPNSKFKFEFKKRKNFQKNSKNTSRCDESNGVKFSQKFVRLTYFLGI